VFWIRQKPGKCLRPTARERTVTGRNEIYVRPFPSGDGQWQISTDGGVYPRWRGDSREIFYLTARTGGKLMAVPVNTTESTLEAGARPRSSIRAT
jgi:hypothetical protein